MASNFNKIRDGLNLGILATDPVDAQDGDIWYALDLNKFRKQQNGIISDLDTTSAANIGYQEFTNTPGFLVRADSSTNVTISSLFNGVAFGSPSITLLTGMLILLKNQANSWENGIYVVGATSGTTVRHSSYNTAASLVKVLVFVNNQDDTTLTAAGPTARWYQNNTITNLTSDTQSWTNTPTWTYSFTVPAGVSQLDIIASGGGGGGGGSAGSQTGGANTAGGGGGAGATPQRAKYTVTPGEVLTISLGVGGNGGGRGANAPGSGTAGTAGTATRVTSTNVDLYASGASFGLPSTVGNNPGAGGTDLVDLISPLIGPAGAGGNGGSAATAGEDSGISYFHGTAAAGGVPGTNGGGGGAGGPGIDLGGIGGHGMSGASITNTRTSGADGSRGSGGGGAGGTTAGQGFGAIGSFGGDGCVRIYWIG